MPVSLEEMLLPPDSSEDMPPPNSASSKEVALDSMPVFVLPHTCDFEIQEQFLGRLNRSCVGT